MKLQTVLAAFLCLAACTLTAQNRTSGQGSGNSRDGILASPSSSRSSGSSGRSTSKSVANNSARRGIFDIATSSDSGKNTSVSPATGRTETKASPFGTTSPRTKASSTRRWKTTSKLAECIRDKAIPSNTNFSFSGTITDIVTDGRYTILTLFDSVSTTTENGATGDVPVTFTVVTDAEIAENTTLKAGTRKSFTIDSNYVYFVWNDSGCTVRAVDNALTETDPKPVSATQKR